MNAYYETAEKLGVQVRYESEVRELAVQDGEFDDGGRGERRRSGRRFRRRRWSSRRAASRRTSPGSRSTGATPPTTSSFAARRTTRARMLASLLERGAMPVADEREFHAVAVDARAPKFDGGIVTRLDSVPFGIVVNRHGERFYDEGEDFWPKRYAIWGGLIARSQTRSPTRSSTPTRSTSSCRRSFRRSKRGPSRNWPRSWALEPTTVAETVRASTTARPARAMSITRCLDDATPKGSTPPKSHWAVPINTAAVLRLPAPARHHLHLHGRDRGRAAASSCTTDGRSPNIFAAGEIMAGNILGRGYLAGFGLTIGAVFGRIAGKEAACHAGA